MNEKKEPITSLDKDPAYIAARIRLAELEAADLENKIAKFQHEFYKTSSLNDEHFIYNFSEQVSSSSVKQCINALGQWVRIQEAKGVENKQLEIIWNSPGGGVFDGLALYDYILHLRDHHHVTVISSAVGMVASMGGVLLQVGSKGQRRMSRHCWLMIHEVSAGESGKTSTREDAVILSKRLQNQLINILAERSAMSAPAIRAKWERKDWWLTANQAKKLGFVDTIL